MGSPRITVAVDARPLTTPVSGVARMISRIIEHLPDDDLEFHLFSPRNWHRDFDDLVKQGNVIWNQSHGLLTGKAGLWYNASLPFILGKMKPTIYWGTQQTVPAFFTHGIPVVLTFHDFVSYRFPSTIRLLARLQQRMLQRASVAKADFIIANSKQTADEIRTFFRVEPSRLRIGYPGFDVPERTAERRRRPLPLSIQGPYMLSVSTLEPRKNFGLLIEAYLRYHRNETNRPYSLVLAGRRGWETKKFYSRLEEIQQETGSLFVIEGLRDDQIDDLYEDAAFFCLPSLYEGFGIPLLESMCHGRPALVSDLAVFHEIAGDQAVYLPPDDVDAWAQALTQAVGQHRSGAMKELDFDCERWHWKHTAAVYREAFRELAS